TATASEYNARLARFFHAGPFGTAERPSSIGADIEAYLLPQFRIEGEGISPHSEADFFIGVEGLVPPQTLALLFQVSDGTANPLAVKPDDHIAWSYLRGNEWIPFLETEVV